MFYGFEHQYGSDMRDEAGDMIGTLHVFKQRSVRDVWVERGSDYLTEPGCRTVVPARFAARWKRVSGKVTGP